MPEPELQIGGRVETTEIDIPGPVAEPASHLHQGVVHLRGAQEVTYGKAFEREPSGKLVAANGNNAQALRSGAVVVDGILSFAIDNLRLDFFNRVDQMLPDLLPSSGGE